MAIGRGSGGGGAGGKKPWWHYGGGAGGSWVKGYGPAIPPAGLGGRSGAPTGGAGGLAGRGAGGLSAGGGGAGGMPTGGMPAPPVPAGGGERKIWEGSGPDGVMTADDLREFQERDDKGDWKARLAPFRGPQTGGPAPRAGDRVGNRIYGVGEPQTRPEWDAIAEAREEGRKPVGGGDWWGGSPPASTGGAQGLRAGGFSNLFNRLQANAQSNAFNNYSRNLGNRRMF